MDQSGLLGATGQAPVRIEEGMEVDPPIVTRKRKRESDFSLRKAEARAVSRI